MDSRIKRSLISAARRLSLSWGPRVAAKNKAKVGPATFECAKCGTWCYEGSSEENYMNLVLQRPDKKVIFEVSNMDHLSPAVDVNSIEFSWDAFFKGLYCDEINYRCLCQDCHYVKTQQERVLRGLKPSKQRAKKSGKKVATTKKRKK